MKRRRWLGGSGGNESTTGRGVDFRARALRVVVVARGCILLWWFAGFAIPSSSPVIVVLRDRSFNPDAYDAVGGTIGVFFFGGESTPIIGDSSRNSTRLSRDSTWCLSGLGLRLAVLDGF